MDRSRWNYSKGPWWFSEANSDIHGIVMANENQVVAETYGTSNWNALGNAQLISAAPELLALLEQAVERVKLDPSNEGKCSSLWMLDSEDAIAKARGKK